MPSALPEGAGELRNREKQRLQEALAGLDPDERRRLYKRAAKLRRVGQPGGAGYGGTSRRSAAEDDDGPVFEKLARGGSPSLDDCVLRLLKEDQSAAEPRERRPLTGLRRGTVVAVAAGECTVEHDGEEAPCALPSELTATQQTTVAVGDRVTFGERLEGGFAIGEVLPRGATLARPDPFYRHIERVVAANIDAAVVVVSVRTPPFHVRLIDRYLIAIQRGGAEPIIVVNKIDQIPEGAEGEAVLSQLEPYSEIGLRVVACSAERGDGLGELRAALRGRLCVFVGHSGVGKSSLLNALDPSLGLATGSVSASHGRGRHTTRASHLHTLEGGIRVIDTPGIREFGLWKLTAEDVRWYFPEFDPWTPSCRYADCSHTHEPQCGVKRALGRGQIPQARYDSYCRILSSL